MRRLRRHHVYVALLIVYLTLCCGAGVFIAEITLHPVRRQLGDLDRQQARNMAQQQDAELMNVSLPAVDGAILQAWNVHPRKNNGAAVILLHGLSDNRMGMVGYAEMLVNHGYDVLLPDARAHGVSGGPTATYGLLEADDIHRWYSWLEEHEHPNCIFAFGESMGAAELLQTLKGDAHFCAVAGESPFSSFREIAYDRVGQFFHAGAWMGRYLFRPVVETAFVYARWKYKLDFEQVSPEQAVTVSRIPVFLIHGQEDRNIPIRHSRRIAAANSKVRLWEVAGADHCGAISVAGQEFEQRLISWFQERTPAKSLVLTDF